jgi:DNA topoisomerase-1
MPRLRRSQCNGPGIRRRRRGRGFTYTYDDGSPVQDPEVLDRVRALVLPPAWQDVWICPWPNGHIQATGTDAAGRRQYRYHDQWRLQRDAAKHERVLTVASRLPAARRTVEAHLAERGFTRNRVLATAFRLLDLGFFRVGSEEYAEENNTYGLATIRREHVTVRGDTVIFEYTAKGNKERVQSVVDPVVLKVVKGLVARQDDHAELLAYRRGRTWVDVRSHEVNDYLREVVGAEITAKDFRTWHATVLMAVALAVSQHATVSESARKRAVARAVREVSDYLGNTPAVCRKSYIDPRVIDLYEDGITVLPALERLGADAAFGAPATHGAVETAVLKMLRKPVRPGRPSGGRRTRAA